MPVSSSSMSPKNSAARACRSRKSDSSCDACLSSARHGTRGQHAPVLDGHRRGPVEDGDKSLEWMLREGVAGEVFAAGHAEIGNDLPGPALDHHGPAGRRWLQLSRATRCSAA